MSENPKSERLKPCPFCGEAGNVYAAEQYTPVEWCATCVNDDCGCDGGVYLTEAEAVAAWNTRAAPAPEPVPSRARALVNEQAEDAALWVLEGSATEAYLQAALRKLHEAVEDESPGSGGPRVRVLVTGGRALSFKYWDWVFNTLDGLKPDLVIQGGATGADARARLWSAQRGVPCVTFEAAWGAHGKKAGPIRNAWMLEYGQPDLVLAFPGGAGTADMVRKARAAGIEVQEVKP